MVEQNFAGQIRTVNNPLKIVRTPVTPVLKGFKFTALDFKTGFEMYSVCFLLYEAIILCSVDYRLDVVTMCLLSSCLTCRKEHSHDTGLDQGHVRV